MFNNIKGQSQFNQPAVMDNIRPVVATCLKPEAHNDSNFEARSSYTKQEQFLGWYRPKGLGRFRESISIGLLYPKTDSVFRFTMA